GRSAGLLFRGRLLRQTRLVPGRGVAVDDALGERAVDLGVRRGDHRPALAGVGLAVLLDGGAEAGDPRAGAGPLLGGVADSFLGGLDVGHNPLFDESGRAVSDPPSATGRKLSRELYPMSRSAQGVRPGGGKPAAKRYFASTPIDLSFVFASRA